MKRLLTLLSFVILVLSISAQTNVANTQYDNSIADISEQEESADGSVGEVDLSNEVLLTTQSSLPLYKQSNEWAKYLKLRKIGWWMFGGGLGSVLLGGCALVERASGYNNGAAIGGSLIVAGTLATLSSVPILICAYHYKYKAKHLNYGVSSITTLTPQLEFSYSPAISISYSF